METTKHALSEKQEDWFRQLKQQTGLLSVYYYGSIQRMDYFREQSDIDVDLFSDQVSVTLARLAQWLNVSVSDFQPFYYKIDLLQGGGGGGGGEKNKLPSFKVVKGYKYKHEEPGCLVELAVYSSADKDLVLLEHRSKFDLPCWALWALIMLKWLYYTVPILPLPIYSKCKKFITNQLFDANQSEFVLLDG